MRPPSARYHPDRYPLDASRQGPPVVLIAADGLRPRRSAKAPSERERKNDSRSSR